ncbi:MAG TPA: TonB-dependent receptor [Thermoanaerobaculia bacterium]|nr:TonB-dependent receptor [Thermoanaerobaculia bacterium]
MDRTRLSIGLRALALALGLALVLGVALAPAAHAQAASSTLSGKATDADGSALPGVTVTATDKSTGLTRVAVTGADGTFRIVALPVGDYNVTAELQGFATVSVEGVHLSVASERSIEISMRAASVEETITVTTEAPLIETTPAIGTVVSEQQLETLPLNGRQFANVAVLAPGTQLAYNADPTKPGQLTIALNGGIGRNVNFTVDGGDNTDDTIGGALQNYNLDAVEEFKIQTAQYKAEYGRSSGGVLTVVTKTGTNDFHGSAYEFARRDDYNGKTESERRAGVDKSPYKRDQYGATLGGPIVRDRAHFFATYEKLERSGQYVIDTGGAVPTFDGDVVSIPFEDELGTAKATVNLTAGQYLQVRYGYQKNTDFYGASALTLPSALGTLNNDYESILGSHTAQIGADSLNEFVYQYTTFENGILAVSNAPSVQFPNGTIQGQNPNTPQTTIQTKYQYKDDFSFSRTLGGRRHDFKTGAQYVHEPVLGGTFETGTAGTFILLTNDVNGPVGEISVNGGGFGGFDTPVEQYAAYFQDDWAFSDRLTLNLGLRYDLNTGIGGLELNQGTNPICRLLSTQTTYNEYYLNDFKGWDCKGKKDDDNWAPRLGFSWDTSGDGRHVLRGGIGRFYDFPYTNATVLFPGISVQSAGFGTIYSLFNNSGIRNPDGSFYRVGQPLPPGGAQPGGSAANQVASPTQATPYSDQLSLGFSWQVSNSLGITADAIWAEYRDIPYRFRFNSTLDANGNHQAARRFPFAATSRMWMGDGEADYKGINLGFRFRQTRYELQGFYTLSKADGNVLAGADEFRLGAGSFQSDYQTDRSINSRNPKCGDCFGPLYTDARHKVTFGGIFTVPWDVKVAGFFRYRSALPYNKLDPGLVDRNGDGFTGDLAAGVDHVNTERGSSFQQLDVRISKDFVFGGDFGIEVLAEMFNVFDEKNPAVFDRFGEAHAFAGDPLQGEQRLWQFGARVHF